MIIEGTMNIRIFSPKLSVMEVYMIGGMYPHQSAGKTITIDPSQKATALGDRPAVVRRLYKGCPEVEQMFADKVALVSPNHKANAVARHIGPALEACRCAIDDDALRAALWMIFVPGCEPKTVVPLYVSKDEAAGGRVEAVGSALWKDVHRAVIKSAERCGQRGVRLGGGSIDQQYRSLLVARAGD